LALEARLYSFIFPAASACGTSETTTDDDDDTSRQFSTLIRFFQRLLRCITQQTSHDEDEDYGASRSPLRPAARRGVRRPPIFV